MRDEKNIQKNEISNFETIKTKRLDAPQISGDIRD